MGGCSIGIGSVVLWLLLCICLYIVLVLVFIMACIGFLFVGSTWLLVFVGEVCVGTCWEGGLWVGCVGIVVGLMLGLFFISFGAT